MTFLVRATGIYFEGSLAVFVGVQDCGFLNLFPEAILLHPGIQQSQIFCPWFDIYAIRNKHFFPMQLHGTSTSAPKSVDPQLQRELPQKQQP